jgi:8-oxo-dGTP pyrophosphatase MutT (NUDIX family)
MAFVRPGAGRCLYSSISSRPLFDPSKPFTPRTLSEIDSLLSSPTPPRPVSSIGEFGDRMERWGGGRAAVGVSLCNIDVDGLQPGVLLTVRGAGLAKHPGECSLPGGKVDPEDQGNLEKTYLRELQEETGVNGGGVQVLGQMDSVRSSTGLEVGVFVASLFFIPQSPLHFNSPCTHRPICTLAHGQPSLTKTKNLLRSMFPPFLRRATKR